MSKNNEKNMFIVVLAIMQFVLVILLAILLYSLSRSVDDIRDDIECAERFTTEATDRIGEAENIVAGIGESIGRSEESAKSLEDTIRSLEQTITDSERLLEEIKKQRIEN